MSKSHLNRRQFLNRSLAAAGVGAGFAIGGTKSSGRVIGANDTIRIAVAGLNGRGGDARRVSSCKMNRASRSPTWSIPTPGRTRSGSSRSRRSGGRAPATVQDIRRVLDDKNVDAISVATPNHWHALMTIWACQAGKDVYVEKPCSHNVHEGRIAVEAARKYNRIVQHGTQSRSSRDWAVAAAAIQSGKLGKLLVSRGLCYKPRGSIGVKPNTDAARAGRLQHLARPGARAAVQRQPRPLQLALVLGFRQRRHRQPGRPPDGHRPLADPRPRRPAARPFPRPSSASAAGSATATRAQTANTQIAVMDFGDTQLIFEVRGLKTDGYHGEKVGNIAHLEEGTIVDGKQVLPQGERPRRAAGQAGQGRGRARAGQRPLRQLHRRRPQPQGRGPQRRHPRGPLLRRPLPPGQHLVPAGRGGPVQQARPRPSATTRRPTRRSAAWKSTSRRTSVALDGLELPPRPQAHLRRRDRVVRRRFRGQPVPDPPLPPPFVVPDRMT